MPNGNTKTSGTKRNGAETLRLTDEGLETPEHLIGFTGQVIVRRPRMTQQCHVVDPGLKEYSDLILEPPADDGAYNDVPGGHVLLYTPHSERRLYEVVDERSVEADT